MNGIFVICEFQQDTGKSDESDDDIPAGIDLNDPYFKEEMEVTKSSKKEGKKKKKKRKGEESEEGKQTKVFS
jgi:hypothetical protein